MCGNHYNLGVAKKLIETNSLTFYVLQTCSQPPLETDHDRTAAGVTRVGLTVAVLRCGQQMK